jgi:hypothetical protein
MRYPFQEVHCIGWAVRETQAFTIVTCVTDRQTTAFAPERFTTEPLLPSFRRYGPEVKFPSAEVSLFCTPDELLTVELPVMPAEAAIAGPLAAAPKSPTVRVSTANL